MDKREYTAALQLKKDSQESRGPGREGDLKAQRKDIALRAFKRQAISAKSLLGGTQWEEFSQIVQGGKEILGTTIKTARLQLEDTMTVNYEEMMRIKLVLAEAEGALKAYNAILKIPEEIVQRDKLLDKKI